MELASGVASEPPVRDRLVPSVMACRRTRTAAHRYGSVCHSVDTEFALLAEVRPQFAVRVVVPAQLVSMAVCLAEAASPQAMILARPVPLNQTMAYYIRYKTLKLDD